MSEENNVVNNEQVGQGTEGRNEPTPTNADSSGNTGIQGEGAKQPFAVFPDEASFMGRVGREAKKQVNEFVKSLGLEKEDELRQIVDNHRQQIENSKTELDKAKEVAEKALREKDEFLQTYNATLKANEAKVKAMALGIKAERLDYVMKLIDFNSIQVDNGKVDADAIETSLQQMLKDFPELKGVQQNQTRGGQDFSQSPPSDLLTLEMIKAMSPEEAEKRLPQILAFLEKRK
jgi:hypothetical protein